jgi:hypothetical protein
MKRDVINLLLLLRIALNRKHRYFFGMCWLVDTLYDHGIYSTEEKTIMHKYLDANEPLHFKILSSTLNWHYWYPVGMKAPRLWWINRRIFIEKLKNKLKWN